MFSIGTPVKHKSKRGCVGWIEATARREVRVHWVKALHLVQGLLK
jgi:hypothetical protein